jgi:hypothetical protein
VVPVEGTRVVVDFPLYAAEPGCPAAPKCGTAPPPETVAVPLFGEDAGRWRVAAAAGATFVGIQGDRAVYRVGSGRWSFLTRTPEGGSAPSSGSG